MVKPKKPRLVSNWRQSWRWMSIQLQAAVAAGTSAWMLASDQIKASTLAMLGLSDPGWLLLAGIAAAMVGRLVNQGGSDEAP